MIAFSFRRKYFPYTLTFTYEDWFMRVFYSFRTVKKDLGHLIKLTIMKYEITFIDFIDTQSQHGRQGQVSAVL